MPIRWRGLLLVTLLALSPTGARAQSATGDVHGLVVTQGGGPARGAAIVVVNTTTGVERGLTTGDDGRFVALGLPAGSYEITASLQGFAARRQENLRVRPGVILTLRFELPLPVAADTIAINLNPSVLESMRVHTATSATAGELTNLPLRDRRFEQIAALSPGVTTDPRTGALVIAGQPPAFSAVTVDGLDADVAPAAAAQWPAPYTVSLESIQHVTVDIGGAPPDTAFGGGLRAVTRSGANAFSGTALGLWSNDALTAQGMLDAVRGVAEPASHDGELSATAGGPLARKRHFFFGSYDGRRSRVDDHALEAPTTRDQNAWLVRTDHQIAEGHRLTVRYQGQQFDGTMAPALDPRSTRRPTDIEWSSRSIMATAGSTLGSRAFNEVRVQFGHDDDDRQFAPIGPRLDVSGGLAVTSLRLVGGSAADWHDRARDRWQVADTLEWNGGSHLVAAGVDAAGEDVTEVLPLSDAATGTTVGGFTSFALATTNGPATRPGGAVYGFFAQDSWRVSPGVTLALGLRYDIQTFAHPAQVTIAPSVPPALSGGLETDTSNWAPRLGIAWSPSGRMVARAAYGIHYGRTSSAMMASALTYDGTSESPIRSARPTIVAFASGFENPRLQQASGAVEWEWMPAVSIGVGVLHSRGDSLPAAGDLNVGAASPFTWIADGGSSVSATRFAGARPFTGLDRVIAVASTGRSRYTALTAELTRRFTQGIYYRAAYTLSRTRDTGSVADWVIPESAGDRALSANPFDSQPLGISDFDRPHRLAGSAIYQTNTFASRFDGVLNRVLTDWTLGAIYILESGMPFSAYVDGDANGDGNRFNDLVPGTTRNDERTLLGATIDVRAARSLALGKARLAIMVETFNLRNSANPTLVDDTFYAVSGLRLIRNPLFARPLAQVPPRMMRIAARVEF